MSRRSLSWRCCGRIISAYMSSIRPPTIRMNCSGKPCSGAACARRISGGMSVVGSSAAAPGSVAIVVRLERALDGDPEVLRLLRREARELHAELAQVQPRDLLVERLGQRVHLALVARGLLPELD